MLVLVLVPYAVLTLVGVVILWPGDLPTSDGSYASQPRSRGTVVALESVPCGGGMSDGGAGSQGTGGADADSPAEDEPANDCRIASVRLTSGDGEGQSVPSLLPEGAGAPTIHEGDPVVLSYNAAAPEGQRYTIVDFQRGRSLTLLAVIFAVVVVAAGRWRGLAALAGLGVTAVVLMGFVLPGILTGGSPLAVAVVGASLIVLVVPFLAHGVTARTSVAVIGTASSLLLTGVLAAVTLDAARFTGLGTEDAAFLQTVNGDLDLRGLLLAGVIIGALGVLDDVTVTQAATVWEVARANPSLGARELYRAGTRVGRDHIASTVNTLVLAYAGASLPLLLLFTVSGAPATDLLTTELVAEEIVRTLVGGLGIVAAVPITTALTAFVAVRDRTRTPAPAATAPTSARRAARRAPVGHRAAAPWRPSRSDRGRRRRASGR